MMRLGAQALVALVIVASVSGAVAQQRTIYVPVSEVTFADYLALSEWIQTAPSGAMMPVDIARPGSAAVAEIAAAVSARIDAAGVLTLDDGSSVVLNNGDELRVGAYLSSSSAMKQAAPLVVIVKGEGIATVLGFPDFLVPSDI